MAKINYGKTASVPSASPQALESDKNYAAAMKTLQSFTADVLKDNANLGKTTVVQDPYKQLEAMQSIPTTGEIIMGGVQGALSGFQALGDTARGLSGNNKTAVTIGNLVGGALGGYVGASGFSNGRKGGYALGAGMREIAAQAEHFADISAEQSSNDALASMSQRMGQLNHPRNLQEAAKFNAEKEKIVSQAVEQLIINGVSPDKAVAAASNIAAINDPGGIYSDSETRSLKAITDFFSSNQTDEDKEMLKAKLNSDIMASHIKSGRLPANAMDILMGTGSGRVNNVGGGNYNQGPPQQVPDQFSQPGREPALNIDMNLTGGSQPGGMGSELEIEAIGPGGQKLSTKSQTLNTEPIPLPVTKDKGLLAKFEAVNSSLSLGDELGSLLESGAVKSNPTNGRSYSLFKNGVLGGSIGGGGIRLPFPIVGTGSLSNAAGNPFMGGSPITGIMGGERWEGGSPEEVVSNLEQAHIIASDVARAGIAAKQGRSVNQITQNEIEAELKLVWSPFMSNEQNLTNLKRYIDNIRVIASGEIGREPPPPPKAPRGGGSKAINFLE